MSADAVANPGIRRAIVAGSLVVAIVGVVEFFSIYRGSSLAVEIAYFAVPAGVTLAFYGTLRRRLIAWLLLTAASLMTVVVLDVSFLLWPAWGFGQVN